MTTVRGSVDFLEPEFLHALGIAVATFSRVEAGLQQAFFLAKHKSNDYAAFPQSALEIHDANFAAKIDKTFSAIRSAVANFDKRGLQDLWDDFHAARISRNFVVHGVWMPGSATGSYLCSMIDAKGRKIPHEVTLKHLMNEAVRAEHLMMSLKTLLVSEGLMEPVGPTWDATSDQQAAG